MGLDNTAVHTLGWSSHRLVMLCEDLGWEAASVLEVHTLGWSGHGLVIPCEDLGWETASGLRSLQCIPWGGLIMG